MEGWCLIYRDKEDGQGKDNRDRTKQFSLEHIKYKLHIKHWSGGAELSCMSLVVWKKLWASLAYIQYLKPCGWALLPPILLKMGIDI